MVESMLFLSFLAAFLIALLAIVCFAAQAPLATKRRHLFSLAFLMIFLLGAVGLSKSPDRKIDQSQCKFSIAPSRASVKPQILSAPAACECAEDVKIVQAVQENPQRSAYDFIRPLPILKDGSYRVYWWRPKDNSINFGDLLGKLLVDRIAWGGVADTNKASHKPKLLTIGSIISTAKEGDVIWGSGFLGSQIVGLPNSTNPYRGLDFRSVRGPRTRTILMKTFPHLKIPPVYGDPALLFPLYYPEWRRQKPTIPILLVAHYGDARILRPAFQRAVQSGLDIQMITAKKSLEPLMQTILKSSYVISSSLHGIIMSEAWGIPARWLAVGQNEFKYFDYFEGTGRFNISKANSIEEAIKMGPARGIPDIPAVQRGIIQAFPSDLFYFPKRLNILEP